MSKGWDHISELRPPMSLLFFPRWYMMEKHDEMISTGKAPNSSTRALWQSYLSPSSKSGGKGDVMNFALRCMSFILQRVLWHVKSYNTGLRLTALLPLWRKVCCGFLSPLKIHRPQPHLNLQTLGPMAGMLTTRLPRTTWSTVTEITNLYIKELLETCIFRTRQLTSLVTAVMWNALSVYWYECWYFHQARMDCSCYKYVTALVTNITVQATKTIVFLQTCDNGWFTTPQVYQTLSNVWGTFSIHDISWACSAAAFTQLRLYGSVW
jgi:hypothetical protein